MSVQTQAAVPVINTGCWVYHLGVVEYLRACRLQENLRRERGLGQISDSILFLQHPPVLTVGRGGYQPEHLLVEPVTLQKERISMCQANRGGGITYHGPGQLVCYPIFDLKERGLSVRQYIFNLEEVVIDALTYFDIEANRLPGSPGVWVGDAEISSIGLNISHGIAMHGFTLNVDSDLKHFSYISACGVPGKRITTLSLNCGHEIPAAQCIQPIINSFARVFDIGVVFGNPASLEGYYD